MNHAEQSPEQSRTEQTPAPVPVPVRLWRFKAAPSDYWLRDGGWLKTQPDHGGIEGLWLPAPAFASLVALVGEARAIAAEGCEGMGIYKQGECPACDRRRAFLARLDTAMRGLRGEAGGDGA